MQNTDHYMAIFHEIKNSVALINSYFQLIEKNYPEVTTYNFWSTSCTEISRLRTIVTDFSLLKPEACLQLEPTDLRDFITLCRNEFQCYAENLRIHIQFSIPEYPLISLIDRKQMHHVFLNLFKNACEAMQPHGEIHINAYRQSKQIVIHIKDTGCGISPTLIDHIFEPFVTTKDSGSGLGLHIIQQIITAHKGSISVISPEDGGTTFTIHLPYQDSNTNI